MQRYIYANGNQNGYTVKSTDGAFFANDERKQKVSILFAFDRPGEAAVFQSSEPSSLWGVSTDLDLNSKGEPLRFYLQQSGPDPYRAGFYVKGYMSDPAEPNVYESFLLQGIRTKFGASADALANWNTPLAQNECWEVDETLQPAELDEEYFKTILWLLLQRKRVLLRIDETGEAAVRRSREILLAVYQALPFAVRKGCGFITAVTAAQMEGSAKNPLPAAINFYLMDADSDLARAKKSFSGSVIDLAQKELPIIKNLEDKLFLQFLVQSTAEEKNDFFVAAQQMGVKDSADFSVYNTIYQLYTSVAKNADDEAVIAGWGIQQKDTSVASENRKKCLSMIQNKVSLGQMVAYVTNSSFAKASSIHAFGSITSEERNRVYALYRDVNGSVANDINLYFGIQLFEDILRLRGETGKQEREVLSATIAEQQFLLVKQQVLGEYECLQNLAITAQTVKSLKEQQITKQSDTACALIKSAQTIYQQKLAALTQECEECYCLRLAKQRVQGVQQLNDAITAMAFEPAGLVASLNSLVEQLNEQYDCAQELWAETESVSWRATYRDACYQKLLQTNIENERDIVAFNGVAKALNEALANSHLCFTEYQTEQIETYKAFYSNFTKIAQMPASFSAFLQQAQMLATGEHLQYGVSQGYYDAQRNMLKVNASKCSFSKDELYENLSVVKALIKQDYESLLWSCYAQQKALFALGCESVDSVQETVARSTRILSAFQKSTEPLYTWKELPYQQFTAQEIETLLHQLSVPTGSDACKFLPETLSSAFAYWCWQSSVKSEEWRTYLFQHAKEKKAFIFDVACDTAMSVAQAKDFVKMCYLQDVPVKVILLVEAEAKKIGKTVTPAWRDAAQYMKNLFEEKEPEKFVYTSLIDKTRWKEKQLAFRKQIRLITILGVVALALVGLSIPLVLLITQLNLLKVSALLLAACAGYVICLIVMSLRFEEGMGLLRWLAIVYSLVFILNLFVLIFAILR